MHVAVLFLVLLNVLVNFYGFLLGSLFSCFSPQMDLQSTTSGEFKSLLNVRKKQNEEETNY